MRFITLLILSYFLYSPDVFALNCKKHKIYCKITKINKKLPKKKAMKISNEIYRTAKAYGIDPMISVAVLQQENWFRDVHTWEIDREVESTCTKKMCYQTLVEKGKINDLGFAQINIHTARHYSCNIQKLFDHDVKHTVPCHFKILKDKIAICERLGIKTNTWSCYHSITPKYRKKYVADVSRWMK